MFFVPNIKFTIDFSDFYGIILFARADVMELADLTDSKSVAFAGVRVRPPPSAPKAPDRVLFQLCLSASGDAAAGILFLPKKHFRPSRELAS